MNVINCPVYLKNEVRRNINILSNQKYNDFCIEYGEINNASFLSKGDDEIDYVWNVYNSQNISDKDTVNL